MHYGTVYGGLAAVFGLMIWMEFSVHDRLSGSRMASRKPGETVSNCEQTSGTLDVILQELCWMNSFPASQEVLYEYLSHPVG
jgi:hypothetical protein